MNLFGRGLEVIGEFELKTFFLEKVENVFGSVELVLNSLRTFECHCVLLCTPLQRRRVTELSNLSGLAQIRAVTKSCHAALVFSHGSGAPMILRHPSHPLTFSAFSVGQERTRLLRTLRAYVVVPVLSQLSGGLSERTNIDVLQQQLGDLFP